MARWAIAAILIALPWIVQAVGMPSLLSLGTRVAIMALAASSLNILLGYGGLVSFGHAAYFGLGAYTVGILNAHFTAGEPLWGLIPGTNAFLLSAPAAMLVGGAAAAGLGALCLRTAGVPFIMITLAFAQMLYFLFVSLKAYGGDDGLPLRRANVLPWLNLRDAATMYWLSLGCLLAYLGVTGRMMRARFGRVITGARQSERRMAALGIHTYPYKVAAFALAGTGAGLAGALMANHTRFVSPDMMHWSQSGDLMIMVVIGGAGWLWGPVVGAAVLIGLESVLSGWTEYWQIVLGPILVLIAVRPSGGPRQWIGALPAHASKRHRSLSGMATTGFPGPVVASTARPSPPQPAIPPGNQPPPLLQVMGLSKRFGGVLATNDVSLMVVPGEIHALIGPNGAGKTTLIGQITGDIRPDDGSIDFLGTPILAFSTPRRTRAGIARTFQITQLLADETALANVALAIQARQGHSFRFWRDTNRDPSLLEPARAALAASGLLPRAGVTAANLSHGERKQLELAIALAMQPRLLLLDEPMAGLGPAESEAMTTTLAALKGRVTMLLVEHDMDAVFALADRVTVLVHGAAIACGTAGEIRQDARVRAAYLAEEEG